MLNNNEAIHCSTEDLSNQVLKILHENGYTWVGGDNLIVDNYYSTYGKDTCYSNDVCYSPKDYFIECGYNIINAQDFIDKHKTYSIKDLADGKVVMKRDGATNVQINAVLNEAFPDDIETTDKNAEFYYASYKDSWGNDGEHPTNLPQQSCLKFLKMEKEIIGYKLVKPEYIDAVKKIAGIGSNVLEDNFRSGGYHFYKNSCIHKTLENIGVMDIWCEPVLKEENKTFKVGNFEIMVRGNQAYHKNDNITDFVKGMMDYLRGYTVGGYSFEIEEATFSKTGCQNTKSTLSEWKKVYEALK